MVSCRSVTLCHIYKVMTVTVMAVTFCKIIIVKYYMPPALTTKQRSLTFIFLQAFILANVVKIQTSSGFQHSVTNVTKFLSHFSTMLRYFYENMQVILHISLLKQTARCI